MLPKSCNTLALYLITAVLLIIGCFFFSESKLVDRSAQLIHFLLFLTSAGVWTTKL